MVRYFLDDTSHKTNGHLYHLQLIFEFPQNGCGFLRVVGVKTCIMVVGIKACIRKRCCLDYCTVFLSSIFPKFLIMNFKKNLLFFFNL